MHVYLVLYHHSKRQHKIRSGLVRIPRSTHATLPQWMSRHPWRARAWRRVHLLSAALHHNIKSVLGVSIHFFPPPPPLCTTESLPPPILPFLAPPPFAYMTVRPSEDFGFSSRGLGNGRGGSVHFSPSCIAVLPSLRSLLTNICPPTLFGRDFCTT